jgi:hypothetical protein
MRQARLDLGQREIVAKHQFHFVIGARLRRQFDPGLRRKQDFCRQIVGRTCCQRLDHHEPDDAERDRLEHQKGHQQRGGGASEQGFRQQFEKQFQTDLPFGENR